MRPKWSQDRSREWLAFLQNSSCQESCAARLREALNTKPESRLLWHCLPWTKRFWISSRLRPAAGLGVGHEHFHIFDSNNLFVWYSWPGGRLKNDLKSLGHVSISKEPRTSQTWAELQIAENGGGGHIQCFLDRKLPLYEGLVVGMRQLYDIVSDPDNFYIMPNSYLPDNEQKVHLQSLVTNLVTARTICFRKEEICPHPCQGRYAG